MGDRALFTVREQIKSNTIESIERNRIQSNVIEAIERQILGNIRLRFDCVRQSNRNYSIVFDCVQLIRRSIRSIDTVWSKGNFLKDQLEKNLKVTVSRVYSSVVEPY